MSLMLSGKKLIGIMVISFLITFLGVLLLFLGLEFGRYIAYFAFPICGITIAVGSVGTMLGKVERDF